MLSEKQLDAIKERVAKATQGPWKVFEDGNLKLGRQIGTAWEHPQAKGPVGVVNLATSVKESEVEHCVYIRAEDANFIAHARQDVPELIAEVERLKRYEEKVDKIHDAITRMENQEIDGFDFGEEVLEILGRLM